MLAFLVLSDGHGEASAQRVRVVEPVGAVALQTARDAPAKDVGGDAVEHQVADRIRPEMQRAVAGEGRDLAVESVRPISATPATPKVFCSAWFSFSRD